MIGDAPQRPKSGAQVVERWLAYRATMISDPITEKGAGLYRKGWSSWLKFLQPGKDHSVAAIEWYEAGGEDVANFLKSGLRNRKSGVPVSEITRRRYFRMLERVYDFALQNAWVQANPVLAIVEAERPPSEVYQGAVLIPRVWHAALAHVPGEEETGVLDVRNRAILLCLFHLGLMPQEVRALTVDDVLHEPGPGSNSRRRITALQLDGAGPNQRRKLQTPPDLADALARWCAARSIYRGGEGHKILFCSSHGRQMTSENLLALCRQVLLRASESLGVPPPPRLGPQIIRNTRLVMWINDGVAPAEVVLRAGLKNIKGLTHLLEAVHESLRPALKAERDDENPRQTYRRAVNARGQQVGLL